MGNKGEPSVRGGVMAALDADVARRMSLVSVLPVSSGSQPPKKTGLQCNGGAV